ncbi:MAG: DNA integrity scanning protein DisA nucleotide-binding domain protein [Pirellulaceae bacterium]
MNVHRFNKQFARFYALGDQLAQTLEADALLVMLDGPMNWQKLKENSVTTKVLISSDSKETVEGAREAGFETVWVNLPAAPIFEKLTQAVVEAVADDILMPGAEVIAIYSGLEAGKIDSISHIHLEEHLGKLTGRDLRQLETNVPLDTLKTVVDLALEIGRVGREGKPVGTIFVIGDTRKVLQHCHPAGFDPVLGYKRAERNLQDPKVREAIKEIALLDGASIISADGRIERACQIIDASHANLTLSKGLGTRHWAAAAISRVTKAVAVVVSETNGTVRLFNNGEVMLRIEPFRRAMKWKDFRHEPLAVASEPNKPKSEATKPKSEATKSKSEATKSK